MGELRFWLDMAYRVALKRNDKLLIGNSETGDPTYIDISDLLKVLTSDDLPQGQNNKYITPEEKLKLENLADGLLTLTAAAQAFYPLNQNPNGYLTAASSIQAAKILGTIATVQIPGLDAGKIITGIFAAARIPDLPADKITSGTFDAARIPQLSADKIEGLSLELGKYILKTAIGAAGGVAALDADSLLKAVNIPGLAASKITSGIFSEERIPTVYLKVSQIINSVESDATNAPAAANAVRLLKEYIDRLMLGIKLKVKVQCATTGNIVLNGEQVIDDMQTAGSRVLVHLQDNPVENGIWVSNEAAWTRAEDFDLLEEVQAATVPVDLGTLHGGKKFLVTTAGEVGVDPIQFTHVVKYELNQAEYQKVQNLPEGQVETTAGAQAKADAALQAAKDYADGLGGGSAPVAYLTMADMFDAQANQVANGSYRVDDASAHPDVEAGRAWFDYKGTTVGDHTDYILRSEEESMNLDAQLADLQNQITANGNAIAGHATRLTALEAQGNVVLVSQSRALTASDNQKTLCIAAAGIILTYTAANLPLEFKINVATNASGTCGMDGDTIDGATFLAEGSMGHFFRWPGTGAGTTKGDWE